MKTNPAILITMEGDLTEPNYFGTVLGGCLRLEDGSVITLWPEPREDGEKASSRRESKATRKTIGPSKPSGIPGIPPLKWVQDAKAKLSSKVFTEAWVVFDHDNHPALEQAFHVAGQSPIVNLAFSSRSFEYFMLLHFERIAKRFEETACKSGVNCGLAQTHKINGDCEGNLCINGYARSKDYWKESKKGTRKENEIWATLKGRLNVAIYNSAWLRKRSDEMQAGYPIYKRNPYVTTDALVKRLLGNWLEIGVPLRLRMGFEILLDQNSELNVKNVLDHALIFPKDSITRFDLENNDHEAFGDRIVLQPEQSFTVSLAMFEEKHSYFAISLDGKQIQFVL